MNTAGVSESPGLWLRGQRIAAGLTQEDLAERSGVSVRTIADMERGRTRRPYPSSVRALIRALGLPDATGTELVARYRTPGVELASAASATALAAMAATNTAEVPAEPAGAAVAAAALIAPAGTAIRAETAATAAMSSFPEERM